MPLQQYLLLSLADHPVAHLTSERQGESPTRYVRCLNVEGRWAVPGKGASPLLAWRPAQAGSAQAAAERASLARGRPIEVLSREALDWEEGRDIEVFTDAFESALHGHARQSEAKTRRLRTEAGKLEAFCLVVRAASDAGDHDSFAEVSRAASKALRAKFGGGSITSAFAWLAGPAGRAALESVLAGEVELAGPLSLEQVAEAVALAQKAELLREQG